MKENSGNSNTELAGDKLVRDRIPELIETDGRTANFRIASPSEYRKLLRTKLREEVQEFLTSSDPEELADILEVVYALGAEAGLSEDDLGALRSAKLSSRGAFKDRVVLCR